MFKKLIYNGEEYENFEIDEQGQIRNIKTNHIYSFSPNKNSGYVYASLPMGNRGNVKTIRVHKAVAETFLENPNPKEFTIVHHKDANKANSSLDNLEWTSPKQNTVYHLLEENKKGPYFNNRKFTYDQVLFIRDLKNKSSFVSIAKLAKHFNVTKTCISSIQNNKLYQNGF